MREKEKDFPILVVMITYIIILLMYLWTYRQGSKLLWGFFVVERLLSFSYEEEVDNYLTSVEVSKLKGISIGAIVIFALLSVGIFIYTPFKYPGLFVILVLGELIDLVVKRIKRKWSKG